MDGTKHTTGRARNPTADVSLDAILAAVAVLVAGVGGIWIAVHEVRRRERRVTRREIHDLTGQVEELTDEVGALHRLLLEQRRYIYKVATLLIDHGIDVPQPPAPSFDPGEYDSPAP